MLLDFDDILDLPVYTQRGDHLGKVDGAVIDVESQSIYQYAVTPGGIAHLFAKKELLIHRDQVLSVTKEKMVVEDSAYETSGARVLAKRAPRLSTEAITRE